MKNTLFLAVLFFLWAGCTRKQDDPMASTFDATVQGIGGDCKLPLLDFGARTVDVKNLVGASSDNPLYYAINLDPVYSKAGTKLQVTIRKVTVSEEQACTTMDISYPSVVVTSATPR